MQDQYKSIRLLLPAAQQTTFRDTDYDAKGNLKPEAVAALSPLERYLNAAGILLSQFKDAVNNFQTYTDARVIDESQIDYLAALFDLNFSRNISAARKREIIQDAIDIYRTNGTERALKRIFRLIGWDVDLDYIYGLHPDYYGATQTSDQNAVDFAPIYLPPNPSQEDFYNNLVYGQLNQQPDGMYVDLYDDVGGFYPKFHLAGENYDLIKDPAKPVFIASPYIRIKVKEEDYQLFTEPYEDADGNVYEYTASEKFEITQEAITYFLEQSRPANVYILEIVTPANLGESTIDMLDVNMDATTIVNTYKNGGAKYDATLAYGVPTDRYRLGRSMQVPYYGEEDLYVDVAYTETIDRTYEAGTTGIQNTLPVRQGSTLTMTVPADGEARVMTTNSSRLDIGNGTANWILTSTVVNKTDHVVAMPADTTAVYINISQASTSDITVSID